MEQIRASKNFSAVARIVGITAVALAAITFVLDKPLGYRIGPSNYVLFLWVERLTLVSTVVVILALLLSLATRQWFFLALTVFSIFLLMSMNMVHSGPNPEAWCYNNLRKIDAAKNELAEKNHLANGVIVTGEQISHYVESGFTSLECAKRGNYIINPIGTEPRCTFHGSMSEMETNWKKTSR